MFIAETKSQQAVASQIVDRSASSGVAAKHQNHFIQRKPIVQRKPGEDEEFPLQRKLISEQNGTLQAYAQTQDNTNHAGPAKTPFQAKLSVNAPGDPYEMEADAMADKVMRMKDPLFSAETGVSRAFTSIQRKCQHCEVEEKPIQRRKDPKASPDDNEHLDDGRLSYEESTECLKKVNCNIISLEKLVGLSVPKKDDTTCQNEEQLTADNVHKYREYIVESVRILRQKYSDKKIICYDFDKYKVAHPELYGIDVRGMTDRGGDEIWVNKSRPQGLLHEGVHAYLASKHQKIAIDYREWRNRKNPDHARKEDREMKKWKAWTEYWAYRSGYDFQNDDPNTESPLTEKDINEKLLGTKADSSSGDLLKAMAAAKRIDPTFDPKTYNPDAPVSSAKKKADRKEKASSEVHADGELDNYVNTLSSSGQSISESSRQFFEPRFGQDFSGVRVHTDSVAAKSAQSINALAYTTGNHIVFNQGQYSPGSESGQRLLAHELTHVVQQGGANIRRTKGAVNGDCAGYDQGEIEQSRTEKGMITNDVVETADDGLIIADFGVDWRHVKDSTRNNPALLNMLKKFESDDTYNHFTITGYSDCVGLENNNTDLRKGRAKNVTKLFDKKLKGKIASTSAAPPGEFVTGNDTEVGRATNRSVIIRYGKDIAFNTDEDDAITGESCANPTKATTISDYIQLISCLENEQPSLGPREILSLIRQISYGGPLFKQAIPCQIDVGDPEKVISSKLYKALREHEIDTVDIGHVFTGLEAMVCPSDSVTITKSHISLNIEVANEDFVTWAGDLGSAVAHKIKDEMDNKPKLDISTYFGPGSVAGFDDLNGDIDGFVIRAGLNNINCAGSAKQSLTAPQSKISDLLREYYLGTGLGNDKLSVNTRYSCFVRALGADVSGGHIYGNMIDLRNRIKIATYRFSIPFFMKIGGAYAASAQGMDILFLNYSEQMANIFIEWLDAQVQIESLQQP